jgi:hypothetical protein
MLNEDDRGRKAGSCQRKGLPDLSALKIQR